MTHHTAYCTCRW